jgi:hypothetical protein
VNADPYPGSAFALFSHYPPAVTGITQVAIAGDRVHRTDSGMTNQ